MKILLTLIAGLITVRSLPTLFVIFSCLYGYVSVLSYSAQQDYKAQVCNQTYSNCQQ